MDVDIRIDRDKCMGSGNCSFWAPATFDLDDEGVAVVIDPEGDGEEKDRRELFGHAPHLDTALHGHRWGASVGRGRTMTITSPRCA